MGKVYNEMTRDEFLSRFFLKIFEIMKNNGVGTFKFSTCKVHPRFDGAQSDYDDV